MTFMTLVPYIIITLAFILLVELLGVILTLAASAFIVWYVFVNFGPGAAQLTALLLVVILLLNSLSRRR